jgi:hypothetical protein
MTSSQADSATRWAKRHADTLNGSLAGTLPHLSITDAAGRDVQRPSWPRPLRKSMSEVLDMLAMIG